MDIYLHSPNTSSWRGVHLKHRDNFTFYSKCEELFTHVTHRTWQDNRNFRSGLDVGRGSSWIPDTHSTRNKVWFAESPPPRTYNLCFASFKSSMNEIIVSISAFIVLDFQIFMAMKIHHRMNTEAAWSSYICGWNIPKCIWEKYGDRGIRIVPP
jgi:hypothetical protein